MRQRRRSIRPAASFFRNKLGVHVHEGCYLAGMSHSPRVYKYYDLVMSAFVVVLLCANFIGPGKVCRLYGFEFGAGNLFFPFSYIFGDILTEVYGYAKSRKVIWAGFSAMIFASIMSWVIIHMPNPMSDDYQRSLQPALELVFGNSFRIVSASILAFWIGEFANSYVLAKMKIWTQGKHLWARTIGSTVVGQAADSVVFYPLAFYGIFPTNTLVTVVISNFFLKVGWEALCTPVTYRIVNFLKRAENEDYYDRDTDFTPFALDDSTTA